MEIREKMENGKLNQTTASLNGNGQLTGRKTQDAQLGQNAKVSEIANKFREKGIVSKEDLNTLYNIQMEKMASLASLDNLIADMQNALRKQNLNENNLGEQDAGLQGQ